MTRPIVALFFGAVAVLGVTACSDSSDEIAALQAQVAELQDQASPTTWAATTTQAPATTWAPPTTLASVRTVAPTTTTAPDGSHMFTPAEVKALINHCGNYFTSCNEFIDQAVGLGFGLLTGTGSIGHSPRSRQCDYDEVKAWVAASKFTDPEWPLFIERECNP